MKQYRPLLPFLTIKESNIEGIGLHTTEDIPDGTWLGISHVVNKSGNFSCDLVRTPLGGFINHDCKPNCEIICSGEFYTLFTTRLVREGEELTVDYSKSECGKSYVESFSKCNQN